MAEPLPRMRIERGRVMHRVETSGDRIRSQCRKKHPVKGISRTVPRAEGPASIWTTGRYWYPDCTHCPPDGEGPPENV